MTRAILAASFAALLAGCISAEKADDTKITNAFHGALQDRSSASPAEHLFVEKCGMCHRQMGMGTVILARRMDPKLAMLESRKDMDVAMISSVARQGLGNMPRISRAEVSDAQLAQIAAYLANAAAK